MFRPTKTIDPRTPTSKMCEEVNQNIQVFVRCRPLNPNEKKGSIDLIPEKKSIRTTQQNKLYSFDNVFDSKANQLDVYRSVVQPLVDQVIEGYNCTVFAYGQTGTGKTYTMVGNRSDKGISWEDDPLSGIIPRAIDQLLDVLEQQNTEYTIRVSFLELYNEDAYDLLSPLSDTNKLRIYNDTERKGSVIINGLVEMIVKTKEEIFEILEKGSLKRQTAPTLMNACSSRSHSIFSITVHIKEIMFDGEEVVKMGKLNLVDLAGSENIGRSGAVEERAREASNINKSLLTLGRVITSLVEKSSHIPYRDSKLTRLLQDSLGGKTKTSIIATISPCSDDLEDTISTLDYAQRAKKITNKPEINLKMSKKSLINDYIAEIDRLRRDLEAARDRKGIFVDAKNYAQMEETLKSQEQELESKEIKIENMKQELEKYSLLLSETNDNLNEKCKELTETFVKLQELSDLLSLTQKELRKTKEKVEDYKVVIDAHKNTEEKLLKKAEMVVNVADNCIDDNKKLLDKVDLFKLVENNNINRFEKFKEIYSNQIDEISQLNNIIGSTLHDGFQNIEKVVESNKMKLLDRNDSLKANIKSHNEKIDELFNQLLDSIGKKDEIINTSSNLKTLFDNFKNNILKEFSCFSKNLLENENFFSSTIDELHCKMIENRSTLEQSIMNQSLRINEMGKYVICQVQSLDNDSKESFNKQSLENEKLVKEISKLENITKSINFHEQLTELAQKIANLDNECQEKIGSIMKVTSHLSNQAQIISQNNSESRNNFSFKCKELTHLIKKNEKELSSSLSDFDDRNNRNCQDNIQRCDRLKSIKKKYDNDCIEFQNKCKTIVDNLSTEMDDNISSLNEKIIKTSDENGEFVQDIQKKSSEMVHSTELISDELASEQHKTSDDIIKTYQEIHSHCEAIKSTQDFKLEHLKKTIVTFERSYEKYESSGETPKRRIYSYPKSFTPTSPQDRIISRYRMVRKEPSSSDEISTDNESNKFSLNEISGDNEENDDKFLLPSQTIIIGKNEQNSNSDRTFVKIPLRDRNNLG